MPFITELAQNTAGNAVNAGMGLVLGGINDRRQLKQQGKLQDMQLQGNKQMAAFNQQLAKDMWEYTGYGGQMRQLKDAGLNPGLMYGMGGGGGQTASTPGGQGASGGNAPAGGGEAIDAMGIGTQQRLLQAQENLINAQTEKTKAETTKTTGVDTANVEEQTKSLLQGVKNAEAQEELTRVQTDIARIDDYVKGKTQNAAVGIIMAELAEATEKVKQMEVRTKIDKTTADEKVQIIEQELLEKIANVALKNAQTGYTDEQRKQLPKQLAIAYGQLKNAQDQTAINKLLQEFETNFGKQGSSILQTIFRTIRGK